MTGPITRTEIVKFQQSRSLLILSNRLLRGLNSRQRNSMLLSIRPSRLVVLLFRWLKSRGHAKYLVQLNGVGVCLPGILTSITTRRHLYNNCGQTPPQVGSIEGYYQLRHFIQSLGFTPNQIFLPSPIQERVYEFIVSLSAQSRRQLLLRLLSDENNSIVPTSVMSRPSPDYLLRLVDNTALSYLLQTDCRNMPTLRLEEEEEEDGNLIKPMRGTNLLITEEAAPDRALSFLGCRTPKPRLKPYPCCDCERAFSRADELKQHVNAVHKKLKEHECSECGRAFSRLHYLRRHIETVHRNYRPFHCVECTRSFCWSSELRTHVDAVHRGIKPHPCDRCEKSYMRANALRNHIDTVHNRNFKFICKDCNLPFYNSYVLRRHMDAVHEDHRCEYCGRSFPRKHKLRTHIDISHKGVKPHECAQCGKAFAYKVGLKRHVESIHNQLKNHQCEECGKSFKQAGNLARHIQVVHRGFRRFPCKDCEKSFQRRSAHGELTWRAFIRKVC